MTLSPLIEPKKILIIQLRQLGDVILTTPLTRQIRKLYPNSEIHFLTEKPGDQIYNFNKNIDKLIIIPNKMSVFILIKIYFKIYKEKYDLVFDAFCNPKSSQFTFFSFAKQKIGFKFTGRKFAYNNLIESNVKNEYSAVTKLRLLPIELSNLNDYKLEIPISDELIDYAKQFFNKIGTNKKIIAFNVVSRRDYKIWDSENFVTLGNELIKKGFYILFVYGPGEIEIAKNVFNKMVDKNSCLINYAMPNILELRALLAHCFMYIGNDGGIKHIAVCANIPTFTIFQNINWANWTPPNNKNHFAITNCLENKNFCKSCVSKITCHVDLKPETVSQNIECFINQIL